MMMIAWLRCRKTTTKRNVECVGLTERQASLQAFKERASAILSPPNAIVLFITSKESSHAGEKDTLLKFGCRHWTCCVDIKCGPTAETVSVNGSFHTVWTYLLSARFVSTFKYVHSSNCMAFLFYFKGDFVRSTWLSCIISILRLDYIHRDI